MSFIFPIVCFTHDEVGHQTIHLLSFALDRPGLVKEIHFLKLFVCSRKAKGDISYCLDNWWWCGSGTKKTCLYGIPGSVDLLSQNAINMLGFPFLGSLKKKDVLIKTICLVSKSECWTYTVLCGV